MWTNTVQQAHSFLMTIAYCKKMPILISKTPQFGTVQFPEPNWHLSTQSKMCLSRKNVPVEAWYSLNPVLIYHYDSAITNYKANSFSADNNQVTKCQTNNPGASFAKPLQRNFQNTLLQCSTCVWTSWRLSREEVVSLLWWPQIYQTAELNSPVGVCMWGPFMWQDHKRVFKKLHWHYSNLNIDPAMEWHWPLSVILEHFVALCKHKKHGV